LAARWYVRNCVPSRWIDPPETRSTQPAQHRPHQTVGDLESRSRMRQRRDGDPVGQYCCFSAQSPWRCLLIGRHPPRPNQPPPPRPRALSPPLRRMTPISPHGWTPLSLAHTALDRLQAGYDATARTPCSSKITAPNSRQTPTTAVVLKDPVDGRRQSSRSPADPAGSSSAIAS
jgi:hypothetical protein